MQNLIYKNAMNMFVFLLLNSLSKKKKYFTSVRNTIMHINKNYKVLLLVINSSKSIFNNRKSLNNYYHMSRIISQTKNL